jgi:hypothetical protein
MWEQEMNQEIYILNINFQQLDLSSMNMIKNMTIVMKDIVANGGYDYDNGYDLWHIEHKCLDSIVM